MKPNRVDDGGRMTPEERGLFHRKLEVWAYGRRKPKRPMLVTDGGHIVGETVVRVSPFDPNWRVGGEDIKIKRDER